MLQQKSHAGWKKVLSLTSLVLAIKFISGKVGEIIGQQGDALLNLVTKMDSIKAEAFEKIKQT